MPSPYSLVDLLSRLWEISWQSAVIAGLVVLLRVAFGRAITSRWRHALWILVLCRLLMPALPQNRISLFGLGTVVHTLHPQQSQAIIKPITLSDPSTSVQTTIEYGPRIITPIRIADVQSPPTIPSWNEPVVLIIAWMAIAISLIVRLIVVNIQFHRSLNRFTTVPDPRLIAILVECCEKLRLSRSPKLSITNLVDAPAVCGVFQPRILLPTGLSHTLCDTQLRLVFLHELTHIKCHDVAFDWLWAVLQSLHWFNPVLWLVGPLRRNDRELARDEMVLLLTGSDQAEHYGRTLIELAQPAHLPLFCPGLVGMFSGKKHLQRRVEMVARFQGRRVAGNWIGVALLAVAAGCALTSPHHDQPPSAGFAQRTTPTTIATPRKSQTALDMQSADDPDQLSPKDAAIQAKLDQTVPELRFNANKLSDVIDFLRDISHANIYVDWEALDRVGVTRDAPITARLRNIKFSTALELIFKSVEGEYDAYKLGYAIDEGVLTITTRKELNKNVVTRRYDINDLLFVPTDDVLSIDFKPVKDTSPSTQQTQGAVSGGISERAARIDEIKHYITDNVDTNSWRENGGDIGTINASPLRAVLLITQTPESHRKIHAVLESLRASQGLQVSIRTEVLTIDDSDMSNLPEAVRQQAEVVPGNTPAGQTLSAADRDRFIKAVMARSTTTGLTAPRLTLFSGQRASLVVSTQQAYVQSYTTVIKKIGDSVTTTYEPVTGTTTASGFTFDVQATASPDRTHVFVDLHPTLYRLAGIATQPWIGAPAGTQLFVQKPIVLTSTIQTAWSIPDGRTYLIGCGSFTDAPVDPADAANPPATQPVSDLAIRQQMEKTRHTRAYLLITPTILIDDKSTDHSNGAAVTKPVAPQVSK